MIDSQIWLAGLLLRLQGVFGSRLLYLGLQGSYRRGEATENSDIDSVVLLDKVALDDLDAYRTVVHAMPEGEKACGFISGTQELLRWPRHELFILKKDTSDYYGKLDDFLPSFTDKDAKEAVIIGASQLMHLLTHSYLYAEKDTRLGILRDVYKSCFFIMVIKYYLTFGLYCRSKNELLEYLNGSEKEIITAGLNINNYLESHTEKEMYASLLDWCKSTMTEIYAAPRARDFGSAL